MIQWCTYHKDDPPPPEDDDNREKRTDDIPSWDIEFLKVDQGTLFELILAANYLDIKGLLDVTCKTVTRILMYGQFVVVLYCNFIQLSPDSSYPNITETRLYRIGADPD